MRVQIHAILQRDSQNTAYRRFETNGFYKLLAGREIIASVALARRRSRATPRLVPRPSSLPKLPLVLIAPSSSSHPLCSPPPYF